MKGFGHLFLYQREVRGLDSEGSSDDLRESQIRYYALCLLRRVPHEVIAHREDLALFLGYNRKI
jgi:hypothetical protein